MFVGADQKYQWIESISNNEERLPFMSSDQDKFEVWKQIGAQWMKGIEECSKQAMAACQNALMLRPDDKELLNNLLCLFEVTSRWKEAADILERLIRLSVTSSVASNVLNTYLTSLGHIYGHHLHDSENAIRCYSQAFNNGEVSILVFRQLVELLILKKDWTNLEALCLKMMALLELEGKTGEEAEIRHLLAETVKLHLSGSPTVVHGLTQRGLPNTQDVGEIENIAELCSNNADTYAQAVEAWQRLLKVTPNNLGYYEALRDLHEKMGNSDKRWCVCAALSVLNKASAKDKAFYEAHRPRDLIRAHTRLTNEAWLRYIYHPEESIYLGKVFEMFIHPVRELTVLPHRNYGLKKSERRTLVHDTLAFSKVFYYVAQVFNLPVIPELYIQDDRPGGLNFAVTEPLSSACGATLLSGHEPRELAFFIGRHLTWYRPEHYMRWIHPAMNELYIVLGAALRMSGESSMRLPNTSEFDIDAYVTKLAQCMSPLEKEAIIKMTRRFVQSGEPPDVEKWVQSTNLTACRAGLLICNDLETATRMIRLDPAISSENTEKQMIENMITFCVSDEYSRLREYLGIAI